MALEPVESSQCCVSHEPTSSGARAADDSAGGSGAADDADEADDADDADEAPHAARSHTASTATMAATTPTEPLRAPARACGDVDSLVIPNRGALAPL